MGTLGSLAWPEIEHEALLVVPVGSVEQHGPHLPVDTDTRIAVAAARAVVEITPDLVLAPAVSYGASGEHEDFPGTISIGSDALHHLLVELGRSATRWAGRVLLVNGHGGNAPTIAFAVTQLRAEQRDVAWLPCAMPGDAHAGRTETSVMLYLHAADVRLDVAEAGNVAPIGRLMPALRAGGTASVSPNGVLGDPTGASAAEGAELLDGLVRHLVAATARWSPDATGMLR